MPITVTAATQQFVAAIDALTSGLPSGLPESDTRTNEADLEELKQSLLERAEDLDSADIKNVTLRGHEFGGSELGLQLGDHHGRARRVIVETILGVVADLNRYREGVVQAERLLDLADTGSADSMVRNRARAEGQIGSIMQEATAVSEADSSYDDARNSEANEVRDAGQADEVPTGAESSPASPDPAAPPGGVR